jgi:hypothetical protein
LVTQDEAKIIMKRIERRVDAAEKELGSVHRAA